MRSGCNRHQAHPDLNIKRDNMKSQWQSYAARSSIILIAVVQCQESFSEGLDPNKPKLPFDMPHFEGDGSPSSVSKRFYPDAKECPEAKLDIWFKDGGYAFSPFFLSPIRDHYRMVTDETGSVLVFGAPGCQISVRIDRGDKYRRPISNE